jgi:hypothetical protein
MPPLRLLLLLLLGLTLGLAMGLLPLTRPVGAEATRHRKFANGSGLEGRHGHCRGSNSSASCATWYNELADGLVEERLPDSGSKRWYESLPMAPIVVATSGTLPEGACKDQLGRYLEELGNGTLWATQSEFFSLLNHRTIVLDFHLSISLSLSLSVRLFVSKPKSL